MVYSKALSVNSLKSQEEKAFSSISTLLLSGMSFGTPDGPLKHFLFVFFFFF